jgi:hypothetical protein
MSLPAESEMVGELRGLGRAGRRSFQGTNWLSAAVIHIDCLTGLSNWTEQEWGMFSYRKKIGGAVLIISLSLAQSVAIAGPARAPTSPASGLIAFAREGSESALGTETQAAMLYSWMRPPITSRRRTPAAIRSPAVGHWLPMGD